MDPDEQREAWDLLYRQGGRAWRGVGRPGPPPRPGARALDLGCGNGKSSAALLEAGCELTGVDVSEEALRICRELLPAGRFLRADAASLPFPDGSFDLVLMNHVLEHLDAASRMRAMGEAWRVLADGGEIRLRAFSRGDLRCGRGEPAGEEFSFRRGNGIVCHYFSEEELRRLLPEGGEASLEEEREPVRFSPGEHRARWRVRILRPPTGGNRQKV